MTEFEQPEPVGIAVLGLGRWGVHWLRNFAANPAAQIVAMADPSAENLAKARQLLPDYSGYCTTDWQSAIAQPGVRAVVVVTPAITHFELITTALELGLHVLVEKPITVTMAEAQLACELAERQQCVLMVDHTYLFNPVIQRGQAAVPALGDLRYAYATRSHLGPVRQDVDVMWDLAIHDLVILNYWLGQAPILVQAKGQGWLQPDRALADTVWAELTYPTGLQATMHWSWSNPDKQRRLGLVGSQGTLIFDELATDNLVLQRGELATSDDQFIPLNQHRQTLETVNQEPLANVCNHFLECVQQNQPSSISAGWQGLELVQMLEGISQSIAHNGAAIALEYGRSPVMI
ncbi:Gfo/Idh/MocA family oxidoreductase [filamentous cyanobacterium LEGE 11480]|uniref:Gfo/Idh/MocA family oxidoreductase n=1 Tax=Romeriopsis navalis LEGE 11480 TaxID=2777977 RepID=A0A928Z1R1_9CYAN|nr:Gfo/Idh/MocA family oxidoreductase [Romeriopsis navalis]MBE9029611.1 Gfo/Idh/MocA family oxidoreductase [Romeriopsis navalis LEGE 11480]